MSSRTSTIASSLLVVVLAGACATGSDDGDRSSERERPADCIEQDFSAINSTVQTCVQRFGPQTLPEEMQMRDPYVQTTVETPKGRYSNPLTWSMEVRRDGNLIVEREFGEHDVEVEEADDSIEFRDAFPIDDGEELEPGTYEFRFFQEEQGDVGTTVIEVEPLEQDQEDQGEDE